MCHQVREFLLEKAIFQLEDEHGAASDVVVAKVPPTAYPLRNGAAAKMRCRGQGDALKLFKQWQEPCA